MSVFENVHTLTRGSSVFWKEVNTYHSKIQTKPVLISEMVRFEYDSNEPEFFDLHLVSGSIFFISSLGAIIKASIKWYLIEPFYEENSQKNTQYGFSVITEAKRFDFYTQSSESLNRWMTQLSNIAIMTDFEQNYVIIKTIDSGQFGTVYLCQDLVTEEFFAVKKVKKSLLRNPRALNFLFNEVTIMKKLDHPNIVKLYKVYEDENDVCLLLEYVRYGNLLNRIRAVGRFSEVESMIFAKYFLSVLGYLHSKGIIHRDLKPENILMSSQHFVNDFKIADFGLSCYIRTNERLCSGSPGYMAPEILNGSSYSTKVDIFSAGIVLYLLISGSFPFAAENTQKLIEKNTKCKINFDLPIFGKISKAALDFLKGLLECDPNSRPTAEIATNNDLFRMRKYSDTEITSTTIRIERDDINFGRIADRHLRN